MSTMDPQGPSQPDMQNGLNQAGNAASKTGQEEANSKNTESVAGQPIDHREQHDVPSHHGEAANTSGLGYGDTGPLKEKILPGSDAQKYSANGNLEGEQMRAPGEGDVADAVKNKAGGGHAEQDSLTANVGDKMAEHEEELHQRGERTGAEIEEEGKDDWTGMKADVDVGEALSGRGTKIVLAAEE